MLVGLFGALGWDLYSTGMEVLTTRLLQFNIPIHWLFFGGIMVLGVVLAGLALFREYKGIERIDGIQAHIFFPVGTPEEAKTLDYHKKHFHHKLIVNYKTKPPKAYYLTTSSYGWALIKKYPNLWVSESETPSYDDNFTKRWCQEKGYELVPWEAGKKELLDDCRVRSWKD